MAPLPGSETGALNKAKIMNETAWMVYCCCEGWGCGPFADPLIASEVKELCLRSSTSTTDISGEDGLCNYTEVCLCFTSHCSLPPVKGAPMFACCNQKCCGSCGSVAFNTTGGLFEESQVMEETFWITYCLCEGGGINKMDQGFFAMQFKELCCRGYTNIEPLVIDGICCSQVSTTCCIWGECQMPPAKPNPTIACCTWRMNKDKMDSPVQVVM